MAEQYAPPNTFRERLANWFYYNWKYMVLVAIGLSVVIAGTITVLDQDRPDSIVLIACNGKGLNETSELVAAVTGKLETYAADANGDGEVLIGADVVDGAGGTGNMAMEVRLTSSLQEGASQLYLFDKLVYDQMTDQDAYTNLAELFPQYTFEDPYCVPLCDTTLYGVYVELPTDIRALPEDISAEQYAEDQRVILGDFYVALRRDTGVHPEVREQQLAILTALLADSFG